ncbi:MAG: hypothetical protein LBS61_06140 [Endomicrobium sp.]|jgi:predicted HTH transcriptional regulator|nr:hypothetical protein [Endomicrobium sp.]
MSKLLVGELSKIVGISSRQAERIIKHLRKQGILMREGSKKSEHRIVKKI